MEKITVKMEELDLRLKELLDLRAALIEKGKQLELSIIQVSAQISLLKTLDESQESV
jgi:hypothetical protein